jgi:hypothetical protein
VALAETLLGGTENFAFTAPLPPQECAERLLRNVRNDMRFWDKRPLTGSVSAAGFSLRFWRNNKMPGDVRARGQFSPEPGGTRVDVRLGINRAELLVLPVGLLVGVLLAAFVVHQLWFALVFAIPTLAVYVRSRMVEPGDREKLAALIRESLADAAPLKPT